MKKFFKWFGIVILSIILILFIIFLIFIMRNRSFLESADSNIVNYLNNNKTELNIEAYQSSNNLFDSDLYKSQIVLLGEIHGLATVQDIDKELFLHLNKKIGLRYYLAEMDSIRANQLNTFLLGVEKDTVLLKRTIVEIKKRIPQQSSLELFQKWSDIFDYNKNLPDSLKLCVIGVDTDFDDSSTSRDTEMLNNFQKIIKDNDLQNEQFYGFFGAFHVLQNGISENNYQPFASLLKSSGLQVKSILCFNVESEVYLPKNDQFPTPETEKVDFLNQDGPIMLVKGINDLKKASEKQNETLFNLEAVGSPYFDTQKLLVSKTNFFNQVIVPYDTQLATTEFFQYAILIRNSKALTPLK